MARYVGELGPKQNGERCNCVCFSCAGTLLAVNAGKATFKQRPHFRHKEGGDKQQCLVGSARAAALAALQSMGFLVLPRRRMGAQVVGLSGHIYDAWQTIEPEKVKVREVALRDEASALVRLDDGREVVVRLVASVVSATPGDTGAEIEVVTDEPELAFLTPDELRRRLHVHIEHASWRRHWADDTLLQQARGEARSRAVRYLDWLEAEPEVEAQLAGLSERQRQETLLHREAKRVLEAAKVFRVPPFRVEEVLHGAVGELREVAILRGALLPIRSVRLEVPMGAIRPDVLIETDTAGDWPAGKLIVEITVTNGLDAERKERIRERGERALEIDFSSMAGKLSHEEFEQLLVHELAGKRWISVPDEDGLRQGAQTLLKQREVAEIERRAAQARVEAQRLIEKEREEKEREQQRALARKREKEAFERSAQVERDRRDLRSWQRATFDDTTARRGIVNSYVDAVAAYRRAVHSSADEATLGRLRDRIHGACETLAKLGFPEAADERLWNEGCCVLERLIALIKQDPSVIPFPTLDALLVAMCDEGGESQAWHRIYLDVIGCVKPLIGPSVRARLRMSTTRPGRRYVPTHEFNRLFGLLFPQAFPACAKDLSWEFSRVH